MLIIEKMTQGIIRGMANRLFHYNFVLQIAKKTGVQYCHPQLPDADYFENMDRRKKPFLRLNKKIHMSSKDIIKYNSEELLHYVAAQDKMRVDIVFNPPILGEVFFDYLFFPPNEIIKIKKEHQFIINYDLQDHIIVGLHIRGAKDFAAWNRNAVLKYDYYEKAIWKCVDAHKNRNIVLILISDDKECDLFLKTESFAKSLKGVSVYYGNSQNGILSQNAFLLKLSTWKIMMFLHNGKYKKIMQHAIKDFYLLSQCDILISSPSTFCVFAGIIGKQKKIIHSIEWLNYASEKNDKFWIDFKNNKSKYYNIWQLV